MADFWHGAGWTFIIWGSPAWTLSRSQSSLEKKRYPLTSDYMLAVSPFFRLLWLGVFFRANTVQDALVLLQTMSGFNGIRLTPLQYSVKDGGELLELVGLLLLGRFQQESARTNSEIQVY